MTNELEKKFFQCFGIEPDITSCYHRCNKDLNCKECNEAKVIYPQITDRILLELICLISQHITYIDTIEKLKTVEELKTWILEEVIYQYKRYGTKNTIKHQVRTLFEEG